MIRRTARFVTGLAAAAAITSPLAAQSWQAIGAPSNANAGAYWNNKSDDNVGNAVCNVGAILTNNPALAPTDCSSQSPVFLPLNPIPLTTNNVFLGGMGGANPGGFRFSAGLYNFGVLGRIAGIQSTAWGIITDGGSVLNAATLLSGPQQITDNFAVWITAAIPQNQQSVVYGSTQQTGTGAIGSRTATTNQQFAVFTGAVGAGNAILTSDAFGTIINTSAVQTFFVGMEDNVNGGRGFSVMDPMARMSDRDYNDIIVSVSAVPEPSTYALMATGFAGLGLVARRRRRA